MSSMYEANTRGSGGIRDEWDRMYRECAQMSVWPWSDVVVCVHRHAQPAGNFPRVLELGCGAGANIPFFLERGSDYHAIEGSESIVNMLRQRFPNVAGRIVQGDFTRNFVHAGLFDLILDRGSLVCNDTAAIERCLRLVYSHLRPGGVFISLDWFGTEDAGLVKQDQIDTNTWQVINSKDSRSVGAMHFSDAVHLRALLEAAGLEVTEMERKTRQSLMPGAAVFP